MPVGLGGSQSFSRPSGNITWAHRVMIDAHSVVDVGTASLALAVRMAKVHWVFLCHRPEAPLRELDAVGCVAADAGEHLRRRSVEGRCPDVARLGDVETCVEALFDSALVYGEV